MEENNNNNPYDSSEEVKELEALQTEIAELENNIEGNGAAFLAQNISPEEEELFFENKEEFYKKTFEKVNNFYKQQLFPKREQAKELETAINNKREQGSLKQAMDTFDQAHSDIKANELLAFAQEELPPPKIAKGFSN